MIICIGSLHKIFEFTDGNKAADYFSSEYSISWFLQANPVSIPFNNKQSPEKKRLIPQSKLHAVLIHNNPQRTVLYFWNSFTS